MCEISEKINVAEHLMVDIETLGTGADAVVTQLAAVFFDPASGEIGESWSTEVNVDDQLGRGRKITAGTLQWYQAQELPILGCGEDAPLIFSVVNRFRDWVELHGCGRYLQVWCKGPDFDFAILSHLAGSINREMPWRYSNQRDLRTVVALAADLGVAVEKYDVSHDALDDCKKQILNLQQALNGIQSVLAGGGE